MAKMQTLVKLPLTCCLFIPLAILCVLRSEKVFGFPFHSYRDAVLNRFGTKGLPGSRVASPFGFTPKKVLGIETCGFGSYRIDYRHFGQVIKLLILNP